MGNFFLNLSKTRFPSVFSMILLTKSIQYTNSNLLYFSQWFLLILDFLSRVFCLRSFDKDQDLDLAGKRTFVTEFRHYDARLFGMLYACV